MPEVTKAYRELIKRRIKEVRDSWSDDERDSRSCVPETARVEVMECKAPVHGWERQMEYWTND